MNVDTEEVAVQAPAATPDDLVLGPLLRRISGTRATIWVQTARPATVEVHAGPARGTASTFTVHGMHYGLVVVDGLPPAAATPYEVRLDGTPVWPRPDDRYPPPMIVTRPADAPSTDSAAASAVPTAPVRLVFGSCRKAAPDHDRLGDDRYLPDALDVYATRLARAAAPDPAGSSPRGPEPAAPDPAGSGPAAPDPAAWPDTLILLGDQVYADEPPKRLRHWLDRHRTRRRGAPAAQVVTFREYAALYLDSWRHPEIRWLLSTVPSLMIFDDHEIIDDWNISEQWRRDVARQPWWTERIQAGLASYWVYQHLGNLEPDALATDPVYSAVVAVDDATEVLDDFGSLADAAADRYRWSFAAGFGRTRLVVLDNRCGRRLEPGKRAILSDDDWDWFTSSITGDFDHVVVGASLPWLMAPALHHVESASELLSESRHPAVVAAAERLRRWFDLEHWAAFDRSFEALGSLLRQVGTGAAAPATLSVVSGDVHHSYVARADLGPDVRSAVHQVTCSPVHNDVPAPLRPAMRFGWGPTAARVARALARWAGRGESGIRWRKIAGPYFDNAVGTLLFTGRRARLTIEGARPRSLVTVVDLDLVPDHLGSEDLSSEDLSADDPGPESPPGEPFAGHPEAPVTR